MHANGPSSGYGSGFGSHVGSHVGSGYGSSFGSGSSRPPSGSNPQVRFGPYVVDRRLPDRGGRARFLVQRAGLSSLSTLHLYSPMPATDLDRLREQLSSCSRVTHRSLAATLDVGQDGDRLYVVREHVDGTPLSELILTRPQLPEQAIPWALNAGEVLLVLAGSEVSVSRLDPEAMVVAGDRLCLLEVGLSLPAGGSRHASTQALASLLAHSLLGAPVPQHTALPGRPRGVPSSLWKLVQAGLSDPPPLSEFLVSLRSEQMARAHSSAAFSPLAWVAAVLLLATCVGSAVVAARTTRNAKQLALDLDDARADLADLDGQLSEVRAELAGLELDAESYVPAPPTPDEDPRGQLRAWAQLHARCLSPRLVGQKMIQRWIGLLPDTSAGLELRARYCFYLGDLERAVQHLQQAGSAEALSPPAAALLGLCLSQVGQGASAQEVLRSLSRREDCPEARWAEGLLRGAEGRQLVVQAAAQAPHSVALQQTTLGGPRGANAAQLQGMIRHTSRVVDDHPAWAIALYARSHARYAAWAQSSSGAVDDLWHGFMRDLKDARDLMPEPGYWVYDGKSYVQIDRPWVALGSLEVAQRMLPGRNARSAESTTWHFLALALTGEHERARARLDDLRALSPDAAAAALRELRQRDRAAAETFDRR